MFYKIIVTTQFLKHHLTQIEFLIKLIGESQLFVLKVSPGSYCFPRPPSKSKAPSEKFTSSLNCGRVPFIIKEILTRQTRFYQVTHVHLFSLFILLLLCRLGFFLKKISICIKKFAKYRPLVTNFKIRANWSIISKFLATNRIFLFFYLSTSISTLALHVHTPKSQQTIDTNHTPCTDPTTHNYYFSLTVLLVFFFYRHFLSYYFFPPVIATNVFLTILLISAATNVFLTILLISAPEAQVNV